MPTLALALLALGCRGGFISNEGTLLSTSADSDPDLSDSSVVVCPALTLCREKVCPGFGGLLVYGLLLGELSLPTLLWLDHCWLPAPPNKASCTTASTEEKRVGFCPSKPGDIHGRHYDLMESFSTSSFLGNLTMC